MVKVFNPLQGQGGEAGPSTAPLAIWLREASLRMTLLSGEASGCVQDGGVFYVLVDSAYGDAR